MRKIILFLGLFIIGLIAGYLINPHIVTYYGNETGICYDTVSIQYCIERTIK